MEIETLHFWKTMEHKTQDIDYRSLCSEMVEVLENLIQKNLDLDVTAADLKAATDVLAKYKEATK